MELSIHRWQRTVDLIGHEPLDNGEDIIWLSQKICNMRIFDDADGVMNLSAMDIGGEFLVVSQFTLHASTKKGIVQVISVRQGRKLPFHFMNK